MNAGRIPFVVSLDEPASRDIQFTYVLESGDATAGQDFQGAGGNITIASGQASATIWVDALNELMPEGDEKFFIQVSEVNTPLDTVVAQGMIYDNDLGPSESPGGIVSILGGPAVIEPASANPSDAVYAQFFVTYTNPSSQPASVSWYTDSPNQGDATPDVDYFSASGTLTLDPTTSPRTIGVTVQIKADAVTPEADEPFSVKLNNSSGVVIGANGDEARATIKDRAGTVPFQITIYAVIPTADEAGQRPAGFTVMRTGPIDQPYTVLFTVGGTATFGDDYGFKYMSGPQAGEWFPIGAHDRVTIPANASSVSFLAVPSVDTITEPTESIILTIAPSEPAGSPYSATAEILDAGSRVTITVGRDTNEDNSAQRNFTITRWGSTSGDLTVNLSRGGTATVSRDYYVVQPSPPYPAFRTWFPASLTIPDGQSSATVTIQIIDDALIEDDETVVISLAGGAGYTVDTEQGLATLTIIDDDEVAIVSISPATASVNEWGNSSVDLTISRTGSTEFPLHVPLTITGTATKSVDYKLYYVRSGQESIVAGNGSVTLQAGESSITLRLKPIDDSVPEPRRPGDPPEDAVITIGSSDQVQAHSSANTATVTIVDNDSQGSAFVYAYPPPLRDIIYTGWTEREIGRDGVHYSVWERYKLVPNWVPSGAAAAVSDPQSEPYTVTVNVGTSVAISRSFTIGGSGGVQVPVPTTPPLTAGGTVSASLTYQYVTTTSVAVGAEYSVPANASLKAIPCDLQWVAIRQQADLLIPGLTPPNGANGESYVNSESEAGFWYWWGPLQLSASAVENESAAYIYIQPNAY